jgi:hypothetical protein
MARPILLTLAVALLAAACRALADGPPAPPSPPPQQRIDELTAQVDQLKAELEALRAENAALKEKLSTAVTRPATQPANPFKLGPEAKLGDYTYRAPQDWTPTPVKDNKLGTLYRSPDRAVAILVQLKPKGAAPPEAQHKYAQSVIQMLKQDFVKNKTEVLEPPTAQPDPRFYLKVRERIKVKGDKAADQTHYYRMQGKDLTEATVITTSDATDQVAAAQRLAEDVLLSFRLGGKPE